jgi:hypothetical protein
MAERSSIDLLSNRTILRGFSQPRQIELACLGVYPDEALPQFLHELTHHWCLNSPVGLAVALLQLEAATIAEQGERTDAAHERLCECLLRSSVATTLLRPIAEGMALFAEFDLMVTSHGELCSSPVSLLSWLFPQEIKVFFARSPSGVEPVIHGDPRAVYSAHLAGPFYQLRTSPHLIDRKSNLLSSPFSIDGDGYLLGYLIIKSLWVRSFTRFWRMFDTDLFLTVFRGFIFGDTALVSMLLNTSPLTVENLAKYITRRLDYFLACPIEKFATRLERQNKHRSFGQVGDMLELNRVPWQASTMRNAARKSISKSMERLAQRASSYSEKQFVDLARNLMGQRNVMSVLSTPVEFRRNADANLVVTNGGAPVHLMKTSGKEVPDRGSGRFSIYVVPTTAMQFCQLEIFEPPLMLVDMLSEGATTGSGGHALEIDMEALSRMFAKSEQAVEISQLIIEKARANCGIDWLRSDLAIRQTALHQYARLALLFSVNAAAVHSRMRNHGFWGLLDGDTSAVEQLARLSCWSSLCLTREAQDELCNSNGFTLGDACDKLLQYSNSVGFKFFRLDDVGRPVSLA